MKVRSKMEKKKLFLYLKCKRNFFLAKQFIKNEIHNYDILSSDKSNEDDFLAR
jgi:hypothetical protein